MVTHHQRPGHRNHAVLLRTVRITSSANWCVVVHARPRFTDHAEGSDQHALCIQAPGEYAPSYGQGEELSTCICSLGKPNIICDFSVQARLLSGPPCNWLAKLSIDVQQKSVLLRTNPMISPVWTAHLILLLSAVSVQSEVTPLSSSILLVGAEDYILHSNTSRCIQLVDRAAEQIHSRLNFAPVLFWVDRNQKAPLPWQTNRVSHFCFQRYAQTDGTVSCKPASQTDIDTFQAGMQACFASAVQYKMSIHVTPLLSDGTGRAAWQNLLKLNPLAKYEGFSYFEIMLRPLAHAINGAVQEDTKVFFALQGQLGFSLFMHPLEYLQTTGTLHHIMRDGLPVQWPEFIKFGISLNYIKLCGCMLTDVDEPASYIQQFPAAFRSFRHNFDFALLHELFNRIAFISVSGSAPMSEEFSAEKLQARLGMFARELAVYGMNLYQRQKDHTLELHLYETGYDDSHDNAGPVGLAAGVKQTFGGPIKIHKEAEDINSAGLGTTSMVKDYYNQAIKFLSEQHNFKLQVDAVFLSNQGPWDIQGIYQDVAIQDGLYRNSVVAEMIRHHNQKAQHTSLAAISREADVKFATESRD